MSKYKHKKHLSLQIAETERWSKYNHKQQRTYRTVDDNWKEDLNLIPGAKKLELFYKYAFEGNKKMLKYIFESEGNAFDINSFDKDHNNVLMYAVKSGKKEVVKYLLEIGVNPNYINNLGFSPFHLAVRKNRFDLVATLFDSGASIDILDVDGQTAIFDAVCENNPKMILCLEMNGADVNQKNNEGLTPLMISAHNAKRQEAMLQLLCLGVDVNVVDSTGKNAFMHAIMHENNPMMDILLKHGTNINARDNKFKTALMYCAKTGNREGLRVLIARGADIFAKDIHGKTALDHAKKYGFKTCEEVLTKAEKICKNEDLTAEEKIMLLKQFARHNKVANSCAR